MRTTIIAGLLTTCLLSSQASWAAVVPSVRGKIPNFCNTKVLIAFLKSGVGGGIAGLTSYAAGTGATALSVTYWGEGIAALESAGFALGTVGATLGAAAAATFATISSVWLGSCKHRATVYNDTNQTIYCKADINNSADPRLREVEADKTWTVEATLAFTFNSVSCSTNKSSAKNCRKHNFKGCEWYATSNEVNCSGESQLYLTSDNKVSAKCFKNNGASYILKN